MKITENCTLKERNTFGIDAQTRFFAEWSTEQELKDILPELKRPLFVMGGGSNLLFMNNWNGTILHSAIKDINIVAMDSNTVLVRVGSGVVWDDFVSYAVQHGWWGIENLSAIPGEIGASAVQNIGAYGMEAKDVIESVQAVSLTDGSTRVFNVGECAYSYRQSIFKNELKGMYAVTYVTYRLSLNPNPKLDYGALAQEVDKLGGAQLSNIRNAVTAIRNSKLPNPAILGNAGSFFMNPVVQAQTADSIKALYPDMPSYQAPNGMVKIPAGWLIEQSGWKGQSLGPARCYEKQALVLVNTGGATGADIKRLADTIIRDVHSKFGITLSTEVNYI